MSKRTASRYSFSGGTKDTSRGYREKVSQRPRNMPEEVLHESENNERRGFYSEVPMAVVGGSVSVGMSTEFAREKIEVVVWESRPVRDNPADRQRVSSEINTELKYRAMEHLDACAREFFPDIAGDLSPKVKDS